MATVLDWFEVKIRINGDRITQDGKKVEGGKVVSRHYNVKHLYQAVERAKAEKIGTVLCCNKIHHDDIIGDVNNFKSLMKLIEKPRTVEELRKEEKFAKDVIVQNMTLDSIIYGNKNKGKVNMEKVKRSERIEDKRKDKRELALD